MKTIRVSRLLVALAAAWLLAAPRAQAQAEDAASREALQAFERAMEQLQARDYDGAIQSYARSLELLERAELPARAKDQIRQIAHYNTACAYSLKGDKERALEHFARALQAGFEDWEHIAQDTDLDPIRDEPRFQQIMEDAKARARQAERERHAKEREALLAQLGERALFDFDFELTDLAGEPLRLRDFRGQVVLVDIWGTWCPPCRAEIPHLIELYQRYKGKGFAIVGLSRERVGGEQAVELVREFASEHEIPYRLGVIEADFLKKIPGFQGFPTLLFIDRQGRVRLVKVGYTEGVVLEGVIEKLLAEQLAPAPGEQGEAQGGKPERRLF
ncbi:MAG: hypothetical protein KatS3mg102_0511 [Planctomycetota bacterium]|nr:MAG: hypothetical protein KatS3mg102_0511 [Planctomycetota bacterium]